MKDFGTSFLFYRRLMGLSSYEVKFLELKVNTV